MPAEIRSSAGHAEMSTVEERPSIPLDSAPENSSEDQPREPLSGERLEEIAGTLGDLPALPDVALRAMRLAENAEWDLKELDVTIRRDQALAARFLRLANSAFFGARSKIATLDRAINMVGITRARSVLLAAALEGLHESKRSNFKGKVLWDHALAAGCISQHLAVAHGRSDSEEAFIAGLLHDIGRPILDQILGDLYAEVITFVKDGGAASLLSAEQRVFRFDHTDIGFVAVTGWGFPPAIAEAIRFHHDPTMAEADLPLCATVSLANSMCAKAELGPDRQPELDLATLPSTEILGLATTVDGLWGQVPRIVQQAASGY